MARRVVQRGVGREMLGKIFEKGRWTNREKILAVFLEKNQSDLGDVATVRFVQQVMASKSKIAKARKAIKDLKAEKGMLLFSREGGQSDAKKSKELMRIRRQISDLEEKINHELKKLLLSQKGFKNSEKDRSCQCNNEVYFLAIKCAKWIQCLEIKGLILVNKCDVHLTEKGVKYLCALEPGFFKEKAYGRWSEIATKLQLSSIPEGVRSLKKAVKDRLEELSDDGVLRLTGKTKNEILGIVEAEFITGSKMAVTNFKEEVAHNDDAVVKTDSSQGIEIPKVYDIRRCKCSVKLMKIAKTLGVSKELPVYMMGLKKIIIARIKQLEEQALQEAA